MNQKEKELVSKLEKVTYLLTALFTLFIITYIVVGFILFPSTVSKVYYFLNNKDFTYKDRIIDKISLTTKAFLYPFNMGIDKEKVNNQLKSDLEKYIKYTWTNERPANLKMSYDPHFNGRHFIFDNSLLFNEFDYYLVLFMQECNSLEKKNLSDKQFNIKANVCNRVIVTNFKRHISNTNRMTFIFRIMKGHLLDAIKKEVLSYVPIKLKELKIDSTVIDSAISSDSTSIEPQIDAKPNIPKQ
ncbi:hypothetical protein [Fibrobacter sp. UWB12]|uniref:hypothetical protein n=1 Tax=Fibrobacter sp. UWB12 TaxID=1896203 RepID=UPI00091B5FB5|nr:hypothetical protein [Fibrobacter sp. UWB12]SHK27724.1 hypothetical protein SAMN05720759_101467 [Fibrobacter sp. UWB12]